MRCEPIIDEELGVTTGFVCRSGSRRPKPCVGCGRDGTRLCDGLTEPLTFGAKPTTCDASLCTRCARPGAGGTDLCPPCVSAPANRAIAP